MMQRNSPPKPTEAELAILRVLWESGPATVRQVQEVLTEQRGTGYTTTLKLMQIMLQKGLLQRDESGHAHVYRPAISQRRTQRHLVADFLDQVFSGSASKLVMQALQTGSLSAEELAEIRSLLDETKENG